MHTILKHEKYFSQLNMEKTNADTINGNTKLIEGSSRASILLLEETIININKSLFFSKSTRNLLSFKEICRQWRKMILSIYALLKLSWVKGL